MRMTGDFITDMQAMARMVAPEIDQPLHILRQQDVPRLPVPFARAWCQRQPTPATQVALQDAGLWRGPGPVVIFVERLTDRLEAFGRFLHELAHVVPYMPASEPTYTLDELAASRSAQAAWAIAPDPVDLPRWADGHGREYLRVACHLWFRAYELCYLDVPPRYVLHHEYDLSPLGSYIDALTPELRTTDPGTPFADVVALPLPDAFQSLFEADKAAWLQRQKESP